MWLDNKKVTLCCMTLPRKIWLLWLQGWQSAPELVNKVRESWRFHNPDWDIVLLDNKNVHQYIDLPSMKRARLPILRSTISNAAISDIIRLKLLAKFGGVWADATMVCLRPLNGWVDEAIKPSGFWMYHGRDRGRGPASWFMMSTPRSYIAVEWDKLSDRFWNGRPRRVQYFWMDQLFAQLAKSDSRFLEEWKRVPFLDCNIDGGAHYFAGREYQFDPDRLELIQTCPPNAIKLSWKGELHEKTNAWHVLSAAMQRRDILPVEWESAPSFEDACFFP